MKHRILITLSASAIVLTSVAADAHVAVDLRSVLNDATGLGEFKSCAAVSSTRRVHKNNDLRRRQYRKLTAEAVHKALNDGYNYALMSPPREWKFRETQDIVRYGFGRARLDTVKGKAQLSTAVPCLAIDDIAAFDLVWHPGKADALSPQTAILDLRNFAAVEGLDIEAPQRTRYFHPMRFAKFGARETAESQYDLKQQAVGCKTTYSILSGD